MIWSSCSVLWIRTNILVSQPANQSEKRRLVRAAWISSPPWGRCGATLWLNRKTRGFSPLLLLLRGRVLDKPGQSACLKATTTAVSLCSAQSPLCWAAVMSRSHHAALTHGQAHTNLRMPCLLPLQHQQHITAILFSPNKTQHMGWSLWVSLYSLSGLFFLLLS